MSEVVEEEGGGVTASSLGFPPYQRRHLQSNTYQSLLQIFTLFGKPNNFNPIENKSIDFKILEEIEDTLFSNEVEEEDDSVNLDSFVKDLEVEEGEIPDADIGDNVGQVSGECSNQGEKGRGVELSNLSIVGMVDSRDNTLPTDSREKRSQLDYSDIYKSKERDGTDGVCDAEPRNNEVKKPRVMTEKRKESKKRNKRKKRAELDKMSGVKRLKLQPISKPKEVKYCKHYLNGSCHQGDSCKYSHDIKKPEFCKYFLNNCLKGADCPYDHDPSKYPCHKYQSEGFCVRGSACQFSHKVPLAKSSSPASDVKQKAEKNSPLQGSAISGRQPNKGSISKESLNMSKKITREAPSSLGTVRHQGQNTLDLKPPAQAPKGISFLMFGNDSSKQPNGQLPPVGDNVASTCYKNQGVSERLYGSNETLGRMSSSSLPVCQSSTMIGEGRDKNLHKSAQKAPSSTSYESKMNDQSVPLTASIGNIPTISSILQDFLFVGQ